MTVIQKVINNLFGLKTFGGTIRPSYSNHDVINLTDVDYSSIKDFSWTENSRGAIIREAYGGNPYVFMVVDRLSSISSSLERIITDVNNPDKEIIIPPDLQQLFITPNSKEDFLQLRYRLESSLRAGGECFLVGETAEGFSGVQELWSPINQNVTINIGTRGEVLSYTVTYFDDIQVYEPDEVLHIYKPDITRDNEYGLSSLRAQRKVWQSNNEVWASEASLHKNKGISGVLYVDGGRAMSPSERREIQSDYDAEYTGVRKFGKVKVSSQKLGYLPMGMNPNDLKSLETRIDHLRTTCAGFNVSSQLFGDVASSTYNNMKEAKEAMYVDAILPESRIIDSKLTSWLLHGKFKMPDTTIYKVDRDKIEAINKINKDLSSKVVGEVQAGILTPEQGLEILYPELEYETGDEDE